MSTDNGAETIVNHSNRNGVSALTAALGSKDVVHRQKARGQLVALGSAVVPNLLHCLRDPRRQVRWEAAKALEEIADPGTAEFLVQLLEQDEDEDVRWIAGRALVALGQAGLRTVLMALESRSRSLCLLDGAHHVLSEFDRPRYRIVVRPVLAELAGPQPHLAAPLAAYRALAKLDALVTSATTAARRTGWPRPK